MEIEKVIHELIYLLRIKDDINYDETQYRGFSEIVNWLFKAVNHFKRPGGIPHVTLSPNDHKWLMEKLKCEGNTLAYKLFQQTISLLVMNASITSSDAFNIRLRDILTNNIEGLKIAKTINDLTNVEPYYIWQAVTTPEERGVLIARVGENFFNEQNKLLRKFRSKNPDNANEELASLKEKVDKHLPSGVKAAIYGRLRVYKDIKDKVPEAKEILRDRKGTKQLTVAEVHRYAKQLGALSLFAPENIYATAHNVILKPIEIMDLTRNVYLNPDTDTIFYYKQDIESCFTMKNLLTKREDNTITKGESALLSTIETRMITFIPGTHRRM